MENQGRVSGNDKLATTLGRGVDQASIGAHDAINQISDAARPAMDRMASNAHDVVDTVADVATNAAETLGIRGDQIRNAQEKFVESARTYVRDQPIASLGIAVAVGYVLSRLLSR